MIEWIRSWFGGGSKDAAASRYHSAPAWGQRGFDVAETDRLNEAHWQAAEDTDINSWLLAQMPTLRARAIHETRNNGMLCGVVGTLVDDVVGPDGPTLQVLSDDDAYSEAFEHVWEDWFSAPTFRPNVSGTAMLKLWVRNLPRCGEFLAQIDTDPQAAGPVAMRLRLLHPRRLASPWDQAGNPHLMMGIEFDRPYADGRPVRYWIAPPNPTGASLVPYTPVPPDLIIHEFVLDEEGQARGFPWVVPSLQAVADLRDYDAQVQDAARQMADAAALLYTEHPDAPVWNTPERTTMERRTLKMAPPGWKPWQYQASQPPAQYPEFRAERQRDIGRPFGMPLLMVRLDATKHNYSSARLDTQTYNRTVQGIQGWLSGTPTSYGTLNRLADLVAAEARFSVPALRRRPKFVQYIWTWTPRPHVDPVKEANAEETGLRNRTVSFAGALAARGSNLDTHLRTLQRVERAFAEAGVQLPAWWTAQPTPTASVADIVDDRLAEQDEEAAHAV
jgi:capsid protein